MLTFLKWIFEPLAVTKKIFKCEIKSAIVGLYVKKIDAVGKKNITEREKRDQRVWYSLKIVKKICPNP